MLEPRLLDAKILSWLPTGLNGDPWDSSSSISQDSERLSTAFLCCPHDGSKQISASEAAQNTKSFLPWNPMPQTPHYPYPQQYLRRADDAFTQQAATQEAAQALTTLSNSGPELSQGIQALDCCQPCQQPCNTEETTQCLSIDEEPCYDPNCPQICGFDGESILCNESHFEGAGDFWCHFQDCNFEAPSEAQLLQHRIAEHSRNIAGQWSNCQSSAPIFDESQMGLHHQHCGDGCINPSVLHAPGCSQNHAPSADCVLPKDTTIQWTAFRNPCHPQEFFSYHHSLQPSIRQSQARGSLEQFSALDPGPHPITPSFKPLREISSSITPTEYSYTSPRTSIRSDSIDGIFDFEISERKETMRCLWMIEGSTSLCPYTFINTSELQTHIEEFHLPAIGDHNHGDRASSSMCCWKGCPSASAKKKWRQIQHLKDHIRTHTKHKAFPCKECGKLFSEKKSLDQHRRTHTKERPFKCNQCDASFSHQSTLSTHRRTHTGEKPYKCAICGHLDADHANFQRHKLIHEPPQYKCEYCDSAFKKKANLLRHQKNRACKGLKGDSK